MSTSVTQLFTEGHRLDFIQPASRTSAEATTGWLSMRDYHKFAVILMLGAAAANATVDMKLSQATDDAGAGAKDITGKAITTLGGSDDNSEVVIELDSSELDVSNSYDYVNVDLLIGGAAACLTAAVAIRYQPRFSAVDDSNLAEVVS